MNMDLDDLLTPISYQTAHNRVRRVHGRADFHVCIDCGQRAHHWSYNGGCEFEQSGLLLSHWGDRFLRWTTDVDMYSARCRRCHTIHDRGRTDMPEPEPVDTHKVNTEIYYAAKDHNDETRADEALDRIVTLMESEGVFA